MPAICDMNGIRCELVRKLRYNPITGVFQWRESTGSAKAGAVAGVRTKRGYVRIRIGGRFYSAHRLAWLYCYGFIPLVQVDHYSRKRWDNSLRNLRLCLDGHAGSIFNAQNIGGPRRNNGTGFLGVSKSKHTRLFLARIRVNGKRIYLGHFRTAEEAHAAYMRAKREQHVFNTI